MNNSSMANISITPSGNGTSNLTGIRTFTTAISIITTTTIGIIKCPVSNYSGVPDWYVSDLIKPYDEIWCATPKWSGLANSSIYVNRVSGTVADYRVVCWNHPRIIQLRFMADHYIAFYGIYPHPQLLSLATSMYADRRQILFNYLLLYTAPVALSVLAFGAGVIKRSLEADSHIFVYHLALIVVDMMLYTLTALERTQLLQIVLLPFCFTSPYTSAYALAPYAHEFNDTLIASLYFFANVIQAALAIDRCVAIFMPAWYHYHANAKLTFCVVMTTFVLNAAYTLFDFLTDYRHGPALRGIINPALGAKIMAEIAVPRTSVRVGLFLFAYVCQVTCCIAVLLKLRSMKLKPVAGRSEAKGKQISLFPCYLLIGTCGLNFFGCGIEIAYAVLFFVLPITAETIPHIGNVSLARPLIVPLVNGCGIYVHFFVSKQYRATAAKILEPVLKPLQKLLPRFCQSKQKVGASSGMAAIEDSSTSGAMSSGLSSSSRATSSRGQESVAMAVVEVE